MTDYAGLAQALYAKLGKWQLVADACNGEPSLGHSAGYYDQVARGRIKKPSKPTMAGIVRAATLAETLLKSPVAARRLRVWIERNLRLEINGWRIRHKMSWDQWHEKAHELMVKEYGE